MKLLPKAVRDLQGDLWLPGETSDLLEAALCEAAPHVDPQVLRELQRLMGFPSGRAIASARDQLGIPDPRAAITARNLQRG